MDNRDECPERGSDGQCWCKHANHAPRPSNDNDDR